MPFVFDMTNPEPPEEDSDYPPPRVDQFVYLPAPDYHPVRQPVSFSSAAPDFDQPAPMPPFPGAGQPEQRRAWGEESRRRSELRQEWFSRKLFSILVPPLKAIGVRRAYCRYDGGNDEGFAWFDHYEGADGARIARDLVGAELHKMKIHERLDEIGFPKQPYVAVQSDAEWLEYYAAGQLSQEWAAMLLGQSFGTGEYIMYGAFTVDLESCTITDDPNADPVTSNIEIATTRH